jgi:hypothetical protein
MVALNTAYAAQKNAADPKNRVGDFFYEDHASVGKNRWAKRLNTQEKSSYHYETASGRSNWPNRDPIAEVGWGPWFEYYQTAKKTKSLRKIVLVVQMNQLVEDSIYYVLFKEYLDLSSLYWIAKKSEMTAQLCLYSFIGNDVSNDYDYLGLCGGSRDAGIDAAEWASETGKTLPNGREVCGLVCKKCVEGKSDFTRTVVIGSPQKADGSARCNPYEKDCPSGYSVDSTYHNHPNPTPPSEQDEDSAKYTGNEGYMCNSNGDVWHTDTNGKSTQIK